MTDSFTSDFAGTPSVGSGISSEPKAGFWIRALANICDGIMVSLVNLPIAAIATGASDDAQISFQLAQMALSLIVLSYWMGTQGGSPLRRKLGVYVLDAETGAFIGKGRAAKRIIMSWVSALALFVGYLWMIWDPQKQTWHDKVAHSVVVRR
jgi:uncharacterized RDD family membrane protein YckC